MAALRTLVFKVHNPSGRTAATLRRALRAYTDAARAVLDAATADWPALRVEGQYGDHLNVLALTTALSRRYQARTRPYPLHSSLRSALFADLAATLCAHEGRSTRWEAEHTDGAAGVVPLPGTDKHGAGATLVRRVPAAGARPGWPSVPLTHWRWSDYCAALDRLAAPVDDGAPGLPSEPQRSDRQRLAALLKTGSRPLFFPRSDGVLRRRNFALLRSETDGRYYALLYLLPAHDARSRRLSVPPPEGKRGRLVALHPASTPIAPPAQSSAALCLPLACGAWHEKAALEEAIARPEAVRVAHLFHRVWAPEPGGTWRDEAFYLAITFEQQVPARATTSTYMGIALDEESRVSWVVYDPAKGVDVAHGDDDTLRGLQEQWRQARRGEQRAGRVPPRAHHTQGEQVRHAMHAVCNRLLDVAERYGAQMGVNDVRYLRHSRTPAQGIANGTAGKSGAAHWPAADGERTYRRMMLAMAKLHHILTYKAAWRGLPPPLLIGGISPRDCPQCNARSSSTSVCSRCGLPLNTATTARMTASRVPARRHARVDDAPQHRREAGPGGTEQAATVAPGPP